MISEPRTAPHCTPQRTRRHIGNFLSQVFLCSLWSHCLTTMVCLFPKPMRLAVLPPTVWTCLGLSEYFGLEGESKLGEKRKNCIRHPTQQRTYFGLFLPKEFVFFRFLGFRGHFRARSLTWAITFKLSSVFSEQPLMPMYKSESRNCLLALGHH